MNCPVCARSLAPTLSICPTCGAMMNDSVREELQTKITAGVPGNSGELLKRPEPLRSEKVSISAPAQSPSPAPQRIQTASLSAPKTSPTLVEFQHKSTALPDWRLQLQNAVQQRKGAAGAVVERGPIAVAETAPQARTSAPVQEIEQRAASADPRVANAMKRIAESRKTFQYDDPAERRRTPRTETVPSRPFGVVGNSTSTAAAVAMTPDIPKPRLVSAPVQSAAAMPAPVLKRDTNKLPRIAVPEKLPQPVDRERERVSGPLKPTAEFAEIKRIQIRADDKSVADLDWEAPETDEIEDLAPFSMRFGAGLFDFIIGSFASMVLLSPFAFASGDWFTFTGLLTFLSTLSVFMFLYMTLCLGFLGKTVGMKLFSLELVDAVENEYPTLRQAAVSSSIFIVSTFLAGVGFLTVFFNEERRALHDLLSGTILVREF